MRWSCSKALLCLTMGMAAVAANAGGLTFTQSDIADVMPGEDLWQNTYSFTGALEAFGGLTLIYSPAAYGTLDVPSAPPELSGLTTQPDVGLGTDGLVTLTSSAIQPSSYTASFVVSYVKLGALGNSHPYEVFDGNFNVVGGGTATLAAVPEPASALTLGAGVLLLAWRRRRARHLLAQH